MVVTEETHQEILSKRVVGDAMHPGVVSCAPDAALAHVARVMDRQRIHAVVVYGDGQDLESQGVWGVVSDADLVSALAARDLSGQTAGGAARTPLVTVTSDEPLQAAVERMARNRATHAVVVEGDRPIGVLSALDLAGEVTRVGWRELAGAIEGVTS